MDESLKSTDYSIMVDIEKVRTDKARVRNLDGGDKSCFVTKATQKLSRAPSIEEQLKVTYSAMILQSLT